MPPPDLHLRQARQATAWAILTPTQRQELCLQHAWHCVAYAQARRWCKERPPAQVLKFKQRKDDHKFGTVHGALPNP